MSAFLSSLAAWWVTWGPWIGAGLIPTIITGLSLAPKLAPEATWVQKIWDFVKQAMGFLSVATPKDCPGTFQMPLKLGKVLKKKKGAGPAAGLILVFILSSLNSSCSWFKHEATIVENGLINCAVAEKNEITNGQSTIVAALEIAQQISDALNAGGDAFLNVSNVLIKEYGEPFFACVADKLRPGEGKPMVSKKDLAISKLIADHNWKFKR